MIFRPKPLVLVASMAVLAALAVAYPVRAAVAPPEPSPPPPLPAAGGPVEVSLEILLNKISAIDTVEETYAVDAYSRASWLDPEGVARVLGGDQMTGESRTIFLDDEVGKLLGIVLWGPNLEIINNVGDFSVSKRQLDLGPAGRVSLSERFQATLASDMDFRRFPFDRQTLRIHVESFTYPDEAAVFVQPRFTFGHIRDAPPSDWDLGAPRVRVTRTPYDTGDYVRAAFELEAVRRPGYFLWQVFLPLFLILGTSWIVFWLEDFSDKLSVAFTCLLTLVAFNFYTATLLPQLPYNTFIEAVLISAYVATFGLIVYVLVAQRIGSDDRADRPDRGRLLTRRGRRLFPLGYAALMAVIVARYFL